MITGRMRIEARQWFICLAKGEGMKQKLKLDLGVYKPEPDPPPFKCELCGVERDYFHLLHDGKYKICSRHYAKPVISHQAMRDYKYKDTSQIWAASLIIKELKNAK